MQSLIDILHSNTNGESEDIQDKKNYTVQAAEELTVSSSLTTSQEQQDHSNNKKKVNELNRSLTARQVSMISIAGSIGSGLYLSSGKSLANGGPLSLLLGYSIIGGLVYVTLLSLGEMSTLYPVSGSFCSFARRFGSESLGFAILTNYTFNDMVSVASDLTALGIIIEYWNEHFHYWIAGLIVWGGLLFLNIFHVRFYGEMEYWLAILKVITIVIFFIISIVVNAGHNSMHKYIGFQYWSHGDAPFVDGFKGFVTVFVSAAFSYGGTESLTLTAGEAKNPVRNTPKVIKTVFWRIVIFYVFSMFFIGMNVPYDYPNLSTKTVMTSPFTIVFQQVGAKSAGSFMNAVIMTSLISAGNHALFAGSRLLYTLATDGYFPKIFAYRSKHKVPVVSVFCVWACGGLCFGSSFIGAGTLWSWLQNLVGVSNQLSWLCILITSVRFRQGLKKQGKEDYLKFKNWTYPYGVYFAILLSVIIILIQGWSSFAPWNTSDFFSYYIELFIFPTTYLIWFVIKRDKWVSSEEMDFEADLYVQTEEELLLNHQLDNLHGWPKMRQYISDYFV
ncbi:related to lysine permease [Saccharomycodes ludwigii]|uniref:Related to lysine permease n=1 Tax=Saccharomycodes ludwigii TaxID=36035 RepID=A0A376B383_9ASCO|nr:hypothetical protein SCDLUD_001377 [Saccharomycodes ludwigii]KAH3901612.1 hypothetical protein SCDLUD_001377 [Saccharomycodes ludwigii]SSD59072.1 related to lysine permease [Saccharomycodes ludwigii]